MSARAGELLDIMTIRLGMQRDGITNPSASVKRATHDLVEKLTPLGPKEKIKVVCGPGIETKYIRASTGDVLATIEDDGTERAGAQDA